MKKTRWGFPVLLTVTIANALAAIVSLAMRPDTSSWVNSTKVVCHTVWNGTGYASFAVLIAWLVMFLFLRERGDWSIRVGFAVAGLHAIVWILSPSWS